MTAIWKEHFQLNISGSETRAREQKTGRERFSTVINNSDLWVFIYNLKLNYCTGYFFLVIQRLSYKTADQEVSGAIAESGQKLLLGFSYKIILIAARRVEVWLWLKTFAYGYKVECSKEKSLGTVSEREYMNGHST